MLVLIRKKNLDGEDGQMKIKNMKPMNKILIIIGILILISSLQKPKPQSLIPECFEKADCWRPIAKDYCNVKYDCIQGKCYSYDVLCPESCGTGEDEDLDGLIDCDDTDCWNDPFCHCSLVSFNECKTGRCFCESGVPRWHISEEWGNYCSCVG